MIDRERIKDMLESQKGKDVSIDVHTHCGSDHMKVIRRKYPSSQSVKDLGLKLKYSGIDHAAAFPFPSSFYYFDFREFSEKGRELTPLPAEKFPFEYANRQLLYETSLFGNDQILPFASILPHYDELMQTESLEKYAKNGYLFGLKLHTLPTRVDPGELTDSPFMELADSYGLPVMIHSGQDLFSRPEDIMMLARHHSTVRFCIAHAGRFEESVFDTLEQQKDNNVFFDTSPFLSLCALTPIDIENRKGGNKIELTYDNPRKALIQLFSLISDRLVWGTDEPWTSITDYNQQEVFTRFDYSDEAQLLKSLPEDIRIKIANDNTQHFLFGSKQ